MNNTEHVKAGKSLLREPVYLGTQGTLSVEQIVKNAILGNSHPATDGWYLAFLNEDEVNTVAEQIRLALKQNPANKTVRELELEDLLISARAIAQREGKDTAWQTFDNRLAKAGIGSVTARVFKTPT